MTDEELLLHELQRLEAERKLRAIPRVILETGWVHEAQVEAVIDAVIAVSLSGDVAAIAHARHVGEWCARIACQMRGEPKPSFARRLGVLADCDPSALAMIQELRHLAPYVEQYQRTQVGATNDNPDVASLIVRVASEFDERIASEQRSPGEILREMGCRSDEASRPIVQALIDALRSSSNPVAA